MWHTKQITPPKTAIAFRQGMFNPPAAAEQILGNYVHDVAFLYMYCRFGFSISECDASVDVVNYWLNTPLEGVYLLVSPHPLKQYCFGYALSSEIQTECKNEYEITHTWLLEMVTDMRKKESGYIPFLPQQNDYAAIGITEDELNQDFTEWIVANHPDADDDECLKQMPEYWQEKKDKQKKFAAGLHEIGDCPEPVWEELFNDAGSLPPHSFRKICHDSLQKAIKDLLTPVRVGEKLLNICGIDNSKRRDEILPLSSRIGKAHLLEDVTGSPFPEGGINNQEQCGEAESFRTPSEDPIFVKYAEKEMEHLRSASLLYYLYRRLGPNICNFDAKEWLCLYLIKTKRSSISIAVGIDLDLQPTVLCLTSHEEYTDSVPEAEEIFSAFFRYLNLPVRIGEIFFKITGEYPEEVDEFLPSAATSGMGVPE